MEKGQHWQVHQVSWNFRAYRFSLNSIQPQIRKLERNVDYFFFFWLLKIILSFYTQAYRKKNLYIHFFKLLCHKLPTQ